MNSQKCYELKISVTEKEKHTLCELLKELGVENFVEGSLDCDIENEYDPVHHEKNYYEELSQKANSPVIIYNEDKEYLESIQKALEYIFKQIPIKIFEKTFLIQEVPDQNWKESWKSSFKPVLVKNIFAIVAPWDQDKFYEQKYKITIDPGMAFGTGQHETTQLCLECMCDTQKIEETFLDVGTGSGILALCAKKLGYKFVLGIDIDPAAIKVAKENAKINNTEIDLRFSAIDDVKEVPFDFIVANILSTPLKTILPKITERLKNDGTLVLSGILASEKDEFIDFLKKLKLNVIETRFLNDWCAFICKR